jgi:hypothetical protein
MDIRAMATELGRRGGKARARRLSADDRRRIASLGGTARSRSLQAVQRVAANLRYAAAVAELRGSRPMVTPLKTFKGRLPGIYVERP